MNSASPVCRVAVQAAGNEFDLTVSSDTPIVVLLPVVLDLIAGSGGTLPENGGVELQLTRCGSTPFDSRKSLAECGIRDGDLLVLVPKAAAPRPSSFDILTPVRDAARTEALSVSTASTAAGACWVSAVCFIILGWPLVDSATQRHWGLSTTCLAISIAAAVYLRERRRSDRPLMISLVITTVSFSCLTAALTLPGPPGLAHLLLAMSACAAAAMVMARLLPCSTAILTSLAGISAIVGIAVFGALLNCWPLELIGPILLSCGLLLTTTAPLIAARVAGIALDAADNHLASRAETAQSWLTRLVCVAAGSAAAGAIFIVATVPTRATTVALTVAVTGKLLLHSRRHNAPQRIYALQASAGMVATAQLCTIAATTPNAIPLLCLGSGLGTAATQWLLATERRKVALATQVNEAFEFVVTAAIVPLMCWTFGLFTAVRGASIL